MNVEKLFVVYKPTFESEKVDVFNGEPTTIQNLYNQFRGGLKPEMIYAIFTDKQEAQDEADIVEVLRLSMKSDFDPFNLNDEERFKTFIRAFEQLSTKYGVIVTTTGGVIILNEKENIRYDNDYTSGDINLLH
jgi:DNA polymerase III alpha subunit (gram-positive type)